MMMTETSNIPATPHDAIRQIDVSMRILELLSVQDSLDRDSVAAAAADVDAALMVLRRAFDRMNGAQMVTLPVLKLSDVAALQQQRTLSVIEGGRA